jgi:hypothetical protein
MVPALYFSQAHAVIQGGNRMKALRDLFNDERGHAAAGYGAGSLLVIVLVVLLLLWLL